MADKKISALSAASLPLAGTEVLPIVQSGSTVKVSSDDLTVKNVRSNATTGLLQIAGPAAGATRVMTTPDANFTAARTDAAQSFTGNQTLSTGNLVVGTAGKGIDFSANANAPGMTSELLTWYETGTWTATMIGSTAAPTTPVTTTGYYTRIGNIVHVFASFANVNTTGASGDLQVTGLPFTSGSSRAFGTAALDKFTLTGVQSFAAVYNGDTKVLFSENVNGGYGPNVAIPSTTGVYAQFSITYQV